jgi:hypothetical protein
VEHVEATLRLRKALRRGELAEPRSVDDIPHDAAAVCVAATELELRVCDALVCGCPQSLVHHDRSGITGNTRKLTPTVRATQLLALVTHGDLVC